MKKILIIHSNMEIGGAETSLLGLLSEIDYSEYEIDLHLLEHSGELIKMIPGGVTLLPESESYKCLNLRIVDVLRKGKIGIALARIVGKIRARKYGSIGYMTKHYSHKYALPFLPKFEKQYDMVLSFIDPHYIAAAKVKANIRLSWLHTDFSRVDIDFKSDNLMWNLSDQIVLVSESCKNAFDSCYENLKEKTVVIENVLSKEYIVKKSQEAVTDMCNDDNSIILCSIGRFSYAKNFENIPYICNKLLNKGVKVKWYIIGYGNDESLIKTAIKDNDVVENVIILGKKINPYPYIRIADYYVQPSRFEGKSVTVREAQILNKPVIITNYETASSQLNHEFDGIITEMDNDGCAEGIYRLICDKQLKDTLIENTKQIDYTNSDEIKKLYALI